MTVNEKMNKSRGMKRGSGMMFGRGENSSTGMKGGGVTGERKRMKRKKWKRRETKRNKIKRKEKRGK